MDRLKYTRVLASGVYIRGRSDANRTSQRCGKIGKNICVLHMCNFRHVQDVVGYTNQVDSNNSI